MPRILLVLAVALGAAALASAATPQPVTVPDDGLVYANGGEIYTRTVGGAPTRITRNHVHDAHPSWSPDRRRIVFVRSIARDDADIWIMNADGSGARRLAGSTRGAHDLYPAFSPDGRSVVFSSTRGDREPDVYVMRADGTDLRRLVGGKRVVSDLQPRFSPDGRHVVFASNRLSFFNFELYRVRAADGRGLTRLTFWGSGKDGAPGDDISPSHAPDGKRIAFVSDRNGGYASDHDRRRPRPSRGLAPRRPERRLPALLA